ncbi:MAG: hypothetical protein JXB00_06585 [Bacteroidales bacterium]|nr:hypothetical protein [Bacteroidales bacterium]
MKKHIILNVALHILCLSFAFEACPQIGKQFPSERKVVKDPVTGTKLVFLTSAPNGDRKIYPTHNQWTADDQWLIFHSGKIKGEAMAVHERTGRMIQVTEGGFSGMLNIARNSMKLYFARRVREDSARRSLHVFEVDLAKLMDDGKKRKLQTADAYQKKCGVIPSEMQAWGDMSLDAGEEWLWFRIGRDAAKKYLPDSVKPTEPFGPRNMGAGPAGIAGLNINTGEIKHVVSVPFQIGHIQSNPYVPGQIIFCWETGGKAPQRTWIVNADGSGLRPLYPEADFEWVTHEVVISPDEVAFAIMGHRKIKDITGNTDINGADSLLPGQEPGWGPCGTREKPTGLGIVNINTREMTIAGQIPFGSGFWHVCGSADKRFVAGDDFARNLYLINRQTHEMILLSTGHKTTAADHVHPTFSPDGTKIQIQSAMLSDDNRSMNICIVPVPKNWLRGSKQ